MRPVLPRLIPGMSSNNDSGNIGGGIGGGVGTIHGGRGNDSRTYSDGINTGWAGGSAGGGNMAGSTASAQEVVVNTSGGLGEAETSGVVLNVIPREGSNTYLGRLPVLGRQRRDAGQQLHGRAEGRGPEIACRTPHGLRRGGSGRRPHHPRQALVLSHLPPDRGGEHDPRHVVQQERRQPERLDDRFRPRLVRPSATGSIGTPSVASPGRRRRATRSTSIGPSSTTPPPTSGGGSATVDAGSQRSLALPALAHSTGHLVVADYQPVARGGRLGHLPGAVS